MRIPQHIGFIMDGNGRWAQQRGLPRSAGHRAGLQHIRDVLAICHELGITIISGYLWSTENWTRPAAEVQHIRYLLRTFGHRFAHELHAQNVRIVHSGSRQHLRPAEIAILDKAVHLTRANGPMTFHLVFNHSGRAEIVEVVKQLIQRGLTPEEITEATIQSALYVPDLPDIDLVIRTGGDQRLSNFLLWQCAYARCYATSHYWPAIDRADIEAALAYFNRE
jgi:undecaprenyl diphosphate synthase